MGSAAVFIDGGYLAKVLRYEFNEPRLDYGKLIHALAEPDQLFRAYYYDCPPHQSNPPTRDEVERYQRWHGFYTALKNQPRLEVRLGRLAYRGKNQDGNPIFEQKRVDMLVGLDMAFLATKGNFTAAVLVTGDSDYIPAVEFVKAEAIIVRLFHGTRFGHTVPHKELIQACDEAQTFTREFIDRLLRAAR